VDLFVSRGWRDTQASSLNEERFMFADGSPDWITHLIQRLAPVHPTTLLIILCGMSSLTVVMIAEKDLTIPQSGLGFGWRLHEL